MLLRAVERYLEEGGASRYVVDWGAAQWAGYPNFESASLPISSRRLPALVHARVHAIGRSAQNSCSGADPVELTPLS